MSKVAASKAMKRTRETSVAAAPTVVTATAAARSGG